MPKSYFISNDKTFHLMNGDCIEFMKNINYKFDMIFADPPYFLSNDGLTLKNGIIQSVNKGEWDKSSGIEENEAFTHQWIGAARNVMKENATIWISGTFHNIFYIVKELDRLEFKVLNIITWEKTNPPPNFSCRTFTHSTEFIVWARKCKKVAHQFNYELMKEMNGGKQMKDVWRLPAIANWEKSCGKHPTQKPLSLLSRIIISSSMNENWIFDPFSGSGTTGIAANVLGRNYVGIDSCKEYLDLSIRRKIEIEDKNKMSEIKEKIKW